MIQTFEEEESRHEEEKELQQSFKDVEDFFAKREVVQEAKVEDSSEEELQELTENFWNDIQSLVSDLSNGCLAAALSPLSSKKRKSYSGMPASEALQDSSSNHSSKKYRR